MYMYTYQNPNNRKQVLAQSEIECRWDYFDELHKQLGERHPMVQRIKQCLNTGPEDRPPANVILQRLEGMRIRDPYLHLTKVETMKLLKQKEDQVDELPGPTTGVYEYGMIIYHKCINYSCVYFVAWVRLHIFIANQYCISLNQWELWSILINHDNDYD